MSEYAIKQYQSEVEKIIHFGGTKKETAIRNAFYNLLNSLRSQFVMLEKGRGKYSKFNPFAFTEQGVAMLSTVLKSKKAVQINISIMRTFVFIRQYALSHKDLTERLKELETKYNRQFKDVYEAINYLLQKEKQETEQKERKRIGYRIGKE